MDFQDSFNNLKIYCEKENFKGWDPYDGLNSILFDYSPAKFIKLFRLIQIQAFKRNPINLRRLFLIHKGYNPKGLGLFLTAYCNICQKEKNSDDLETIHFLANKIIELQSSEYSGACWGYNFDWQNRAFYLKRWTPTIVATGFIAYALMDAYDVTGEEKYLQIALSSCDFILKDLNRTEKKTGFIFSYSPYDNTSVYNASLIGSRLLARAYSYKKNTEWIDASRNSVLACTNSQRDDGAWIYGELEMQDWVDSFHTGYNLECISEYQKYSGDKSFQKFIDKGLDYYLNNFFLEDGTPKYYNNKTYPIDIHSTAQFVVTLSRLDILKDKKDLVDNVLKWTILNMQDKKGYFYYQRKQNWSSKIPYIRWAQAWMLYAFSFYNKDLNFSTVE